MYIILNYFFVILHGGLVLFNVTGWAFKQTRRLHLYTISLTILSWVGLGLMYGWGYCPCTEWHWDVKRHLGEQNLPASYIKYYADYLTGTNWDPFIVDIGTAAVGISAFLLSIYFNLIYGKNND